MSTRRPSFQFYPQDWTGDTNLQSCSLESQGFWIKFLCKLHDSKVYGKFCFSKILANDMANDIANIQISSDICSKVARVVGVSKDEAARSLNELINANVIRIDGDGYVYSSRMVRDEQIRKIRKEAGSQGGRSLWKNKKSEKTGDLFAKAKPLANLEQNAEDEEEEEKEEEEEIEYKGVEGENSVAETFERFWKAYDKNIHRLNCEKLWIHLTPQERDEILDYVPKYVSSQPDKQFRVHPDKFLENKMWFNEIIQNHNGNTKKNGNSKKPTPTELDSALRKRLNG